MPVLSRPETVPELASRTGAPVWLVRRLADQLSAGEGGCPRIGKLLRIISPELAARIEAELRRRGYLPREVAADAS